MNCNDIATIMDEHANARLTTAERCALDEHLAECEACALAWHAQAALLTLTVPATPRSLLDDVLQALTTRTLPVRRPARARIVVAGALLAAGAALATVTYMTVLDRATDDAAALDATRDDAETSASVGAPRSEPSRTPAAAPAPDGTAASTPVPDIGYVLVRRVAPDYPVLALERHVDGWVQLQYTIGANGAVENPTAVESSDPLFEASAIAAIARWRYLPRILAGERVAVPDIRTMIRFQLVPNPPAAQEKKTSGGPAKEVPQRTDNRSDDSATRARVGFERGIEIAWQRVAAADLRGAELELDELGATYELATSQRKLALNFYGYVFTEYGDYGRAIAAYESAIALDDGRPGNGWQDECIALANLYFARHQYDMALKTLLRYKKQYPDSKPLVGDVDGFIARLRALGVTEETL